MGLLWIIAQRACLPRKIVKNVVFATLLPLLFSSQIRNLSKSITIKAIGSKVMPVKPFLHISIVPSLVFHLFASERIALFHEKYAGAARSGSENGGMLTSKKTGTKESQAMSVRGA